MEGKLWEEHKIVKQMKIDNSKLMSMKMKIHFTIYYQIVRVAEKKLYISLVGNEWILPVSL